MRKAIIMLLMMLMLIAFVSCSNEPKISAEDLAKAIEDFYVTAEYAEKYDLGADFIGTYDLANWNSTTISESKVTTVNKIISKLVSNERKNENGIAYSNFKITSAKGKVEQTVVSTEMSDSSIGGKVKTLLRDVELTYSYTENEETKNGSLTIEYEMTTNVSLGNGGATTSKNITKMKVNGNTCRPVEYEYSGNLFTLNMLVTKAVCDGINLDCGTVEKKLMQFVVKY